MTQTDTKKAQENRQILDSRNLVKEGGFLELMGKLGRPVRCALSPPVERGRGAPPLLVPRSLWPFHLSLAHQIFLKSILVPVNYFKLEVHTVKSLYALVLHL